MAPKKENVVSQGPRDEPVEEHDLGDALPEQPPSPEAPPAADGQPSRTEPKAESDDPAQNDDVPPNAVQEGPRE